VAQNFRSRLNEFKERNKPGDEEQIVNSEWVLEKIDEAIREHRHDGHDGQLIDMSAYLDIDNTNEHSSL